MMDEVKVLIDKKSFKGLFDFACLQPLKMKFSYEKFPACLLLSLFSRDEFFSETRIFSSHAPVAKSDTPQLAPRDLKC